MTFTAAIYGAFSVLRMRPGDGGGSAALPGLRGVADGLAFIARNPVVRGALPIALAATVLAMPTSLFPLVNAERFGGDPRTLGLFVTLRTPAPRSATSMPSPPSGTGDLVEA